MTGRLAVWSPHCRDSDRGVYIREGGILEPQRVVLINPAAAIVGFAPVCLNECPLCAALAWKNVWYSPSLKS